ncbi:MAG TPA: hypothetical protein VFG04_12745 [Planctomycetaceae bacterium]|nr:hypothetical protein [Planctomycetaceae bacterium]
MTVWRGFVAYAIERPEYRTSGAPVSSSALRRCQVVDSALTTRLFIDWTESRASIH